LPVFSIGNNEIYTSTIAWVNQLAMPVTFSTAGEIKSISIYHEGGTGNLLLGVYSDQNGYPSTRLGITVSTPINSAAGWQTIQLTNNVPVTLGQTVWLSWVFQNNPGIRYTNGTPGRAASSYTWANGMPVSFGTSTIAGNMYSIYCNYITNQSILKNAEMTDIDSRNIFETILDDSNNVDKNVLIENIENISKELNFKIYPNPAISFIHFDYKGIIDGETSIFIIDNSGRKLISKIIDSSSMTIDVSNLSGGMYFVKIINQMGSMTKKLIIEKI
jgi:hypothetical protein